MIWWRHLHKISRIGACQVLILSGLMGCGWRQLDQLPTSHGAHYGANKLNVVRPYDKDLSDIAILWQQITMEDYCRIVTCVEFEPNSVDQDLREDLELVLAKIVDELKVKDVPQPELVFVSPSSDNFHHFFYSKAAHENQYVNNDEYSSVFAQFFKAEFHPITFRSQIPRFSQAPDDSRESHGVDNSIDKERYWNVMYDTLKLVERLSDVELNRLSADHNLIAQQSEFISPAKIVNMLQRTYKSMVSFRYSAPDQTIFYQHNQPHLQLSQSSQWDAEGIFLQRKLNKINFIVYEKPSEIPYNRLLVELLWQVVAYYEGHFHKLGQDGLNPNTSAIKIVTDHAQQRQHGGIVAIETIPESELKNVFRAEPLVIKHPDLQLAPEIFTLLYVLEFNAFQLLSRSGETDLMPYLFMRSAAAKRFVEKLKHLSLWQELEHKFMNSPLNPKTLGGDRGDRGDRGDENNQPHNLFKTLSGSFLMIVANHYEQMPKYLLKELEQSILHHYSTRSPSLELFYYLEVDVKEMMSRFISAAQQYSFPVGEMLDLVVPDIHQWLIEDRGGLSVVEFEQFTQVLESAKRSYNRQRQQMITLKAYPYYQILKYDELMVYLLTILNKPVSLYENYLMMGLSAAQRTRCQLEMQYHDNLLEYYSSYYVSHPYDAAIVACFRIINIKKELLRHEL